MQIKQFNSLAEISALEWNLLAGSGYPFLRHEFLSALELSGSAAAKTGWSARHLLIYDGEQLLALCPLYLKTHSQGEFVFDQSWANAYHQHGLRYYPKWLTAVPFTPCPAPRIIIKPGVDECQVLSLLLEFIEHHSGAQQSSSWHCLFNSQEQTEQLQGLGLLVREGVQFQWFNHGYRDFEDYCATFNARKRKTILRERRKVAEQGIHFIHLRGIETTEQHWQVFYNFYQMTYFKHRMRPYLNLDFFIRLAATMPEQILLILAIKDQAYIGAALSFVGTDTLYGRYWGCYDEYPNLHFEACYYQGLDFCIEHGLERFDSGAQGEHKIARGFKPITTYSGHWIQNPQFKSAIGQFLHEEQQMLQQYQSQTRELLPFRKNL